jgi:iron(III) transport system ATP-binding protein
MGRSVVLLERVSKRFGSTVAADRATLDVAAGEIVALLGPSGCGKTTLLRLIAGFERPDEGRVVLSGNVVAGDGRWTPPERRHIGMVFQDYALFPHLSVAENVGFGLAREQREKRVAMLLTLVDLCGLGHRYPHELSGGQQQRVALARALAPAPDVVLLDEPWSSVDAQLREDLRREVTQILRPLGVTAVLVTHDREEAFSLADRIALVRDGTIVQEGAPEELYYAPASRWAAELVGTANILGGTVSGGRVHTAVGTFPSNGAAATDTGSVEVVVRPELVRLIPDPGAAAEVVSRSFLGHDVLYRVRVEGTEIVSQRPSDEVVPLGARVAIEIQAGHVPVFH